MLVIHRRIDPQPVWVAELHLTFEARSKSRLRCFSAEGEDVGLFLERGQPPLYDGECLQAEDGRIVRVCARNGEVLALVDPAIWAARTPAAAPPPALGVGRERFALFCHHADEAEKGGSAILAAMESVI